ncbi:sodium/potassium-transporting ATPase subunit beta-2-like isoform X1 [Chrysoperla carnea]|uniref:sodium/potassium-transporting ATPase subunit beta-2-like isoform X1 n=1 Tax=Chrysoperla carnea TaxID=189513 RepID=UPI001D075DFB|nr:sodium/potassium-transporting ATPase subunit beta-2-like isoform X1 [Chrysoperla carnea]
MAVTVYSEEKKDDECRLKPVELPFREKFSKFLHDPEENTYFGRTIVSWAKIGLFYLIFYGCLAALVAICMWVFFQTLDPRIPKWQLDESLIGTNPGLGFRPMPVEAAVGSTLIWYKGTKVENYQYWKDSLEKFLKVYKQPGLNPGRGQNIYNCDYDQLPQRGQVCNVDVNSWAPCHVENEFGYHKSSPCIFLKLNKIYGWRPEFYNDTNNLDERMPKALKQYIKTVPSKELNTIWVSCEGENPADKENIGPVQYYPRQGFPGYFFPYENSEGYLSPLVAVQFTRPIPGILINIECKAWAKNIHHDRHDRLGSVHFELMID